MKKVQVADWNEMEPLQPAYALVANVDLTTWKREMAHLTGIAYGGVSLV